jgi:outer membrane immunogenic protein
MRKLAVLSAAVAIFGGVNAASAADLSSRGGSYKDTGYEAPPAPIWGGLYVGGHVGGLWNDGGDTSKFKRYRKWWECYGNETERVAESCDKWTDWKEVEHVKFSDEDDDVTLIGGIHVGYNWQSGARVFGVEADASFGDGVEYLASLRARLGYAIDNLLLYLTAGVAFAGFDDKTVVMSVGDWYKKSVNFAGDSEVGFVVGAGAEYKLSSNWSVGVEGLYYMFGDGDDTIEHDGYWKQSKIVHEDDNDLFVVRARVSYHFQDDYEEPLK